MCGADTTIARELFGDCGSPPRVRSRRDNEPYQVVPDGITSACAEQTSDNSSTTTSKRDHLRVCGADYPLRS